MGWNPIVAYTFENHVALDESGNQNHGLVELPNVNRWIDLPMTELATAIKYDHPETKITVPQDATLANWAGFRIKVVFKADLFNRRLNLVEGDRSFSFNIQNDGTLRGSIYDGNIWQRVESDPDTIKPNVWYTAEFRCDPSSSLILHLNGKLLKLEPSAGDPIRPVGPVGIQIGYWPGGDSRYTFLGLMGSVIIFTLDPEREVIKRLGKLFCGNLGPQQDFLNNLLDLVRNGLTPTEEAKALKSGKQLIESAKMIITATLNTSGNPNQSLETLQALSNRTEQILIRNHQAGTNFFADPEYSDIIRATRAVIEEASPVARDTFLAQIVRLTSMQPFTEDRAIELLNQYPELKKCLEETGISTDDNPFDDWLDDCIRICQDGTGSGGSDKYPREGECNVHIHINCSCKNPRRKKQ